MRNCMSLSARRSSDMCLQASPASVDCYILPPAQICDRGSVYDFADKADEVARAGGIGMLLVNVVASWDDITAVKYRIPTVHLPRKVRKSLLNYVATALPTVTLQPTEPIYNQLAPQVARMSSRGPALAGGGVILKPDITAPGVEVFAAWSPAAADAPLPYLYQTGERGWSCSVSSRTPYCPSASAQP